MPNVKSQLRPGENVYFKLSGRGSPGDCREHFREVRRVESRFQGWTLSLRQHGRSVRKSIGLGLALDLRPATC